MENKLDSHNAQELVLSPTLDISQSVMTIWYKRIFFVMRINYGRQVFFLDFSIMNVVKLYRTAQFIIYLLPAIGNCSLPITVCIKPQWKTQNAQKHKSYLDTFYIALKMSFDKMCGWILFFMSEYKLLLHFLSYCTRVFQIVLSDWRSGLCIGNCFKFDHIANK